jgi:anti-sigma regulatory factor (Ser/Thr protein kinase)
VDISFSVRLPVDAKSVPLARGLLRQALEHLGVVETTIEEVVLALTEACANVVQHAAEGDAYQVDVEIDGEVCRICVYDEGQGFDPSATPMPASPLDGGRGLPLMRALVDRLQFENAEDGRHGVKLEKRLVTSPRLRLLS